MKVLFWNIQRMSGESPTERGNEIEKMVNYAYNEYGQIDYIIFCEVYRSFHFSLKNDIRVIRQGVVKKQSKFLTNCQLGYGILKLSGFKEYRNIPFQEYTPRHNYKEIYNSNFPRGGGNFFSNQSKRKVGVIDCGGFNLLFYHSNSSGKSPHLLKWIINDHFRRFDDKPFCLIGDLNVSPSDIDNEEINSVMPKWKGLHKVNSLMPTHRGGRTLDFGVAYRRNPSVKLINPYPSGFARNFDHLPVLFDFN